MPPDYPPAAMSPEVEKYGPDAVNARQEVFLVGGLEFVIDHETKQAFPLNPIEYGINKDKKKKSVNINARQSA
jgi:hypothetical protein